MGTVCEDINCPNCISKNCMRELRWKTSEENIFCPDCGYYYDFQWKRDVNGDFILKDKNKEISADNLIPKIEEIKMPFGTFLITNTKGIDELGTLKNSMEYSEFVKFIENNQTKYDFKLVTIKRFVKGKITTEKL